MSPKLCVSACSGFVVACLLAFTLQIFFFSPISPDLLELPPPSSSDSHLLPTNTHLQRVIKLGEGHLKDPEDVWVDRNGVVYTATRDGWGLLKVSEDDVTILALHHVNGSKISFTDDVIEASDGSLYFSVASTKFGFDSWYLDMLEAKPHGQLLKYDPSSNETSILLDHLGFANGVALSRDEHYLVVCETLKFRCLKYWLKGETKGETEIFVQNLPGGPDNINLAPDGSFWVAILEFRSNVMDFVHTSKASKHLLAAFPKLFNLINPVTRKGMVINVAADGNIIRKFQDPNGKVMSFVTSAFEFEDHLYLGSLNSSFMENCH
ncbi:hypothetical protein Ddye_020394 [Dipteronia dyeriana]|uniref:Strictosidine synthase conserved region domain-containing protein n=1 Tax=Dipteronia dyeriana TaxID=168575 RepID=A0AAD9U0L4_9ROSI|nr:hypothetical protein Ddye_020394 [Dipteronia dyeriana]